jgi:hypothetical protein
MPDNAHLVVYGPPIVIGIMLLAVAAYIIRGARQ